MPRVVREVRLHGIDQSRGRGDEITAASVEATFGAWWREVDPYLVAEETAGSAALAAHLRTIREIRNMLEEEEAQGRIRTSANVRIVAIALDQGYEVVTTAPSGFAVFSKNRVAVPIRVLSVREAA